jgi:predicted acetyltransferase
LDDALRQEIIQSNIKPPVFTKLLKHLHLNDFNIPLESIHEVNVEAMIKSHYFVFAVGMFEELNESYPGLCEIYIMENKDAFLVAVSDVPLGKEVFEKLVTSKQTDRVFKEIIIKHHGANLMSEIVADQICSMGLSVSKDVFDAAWDILDVSKKKILMMNHLESLAAEDFEMCFSKLGKPYQELTDRSRRHNVTIPDSEEHRKLAKRLLQVDYLTSYDDSGSIKEYDRTLRKTVDQPAILCRVKSASNSKAPEKK